MESFFGSMKNELVHRTRFATRREARAALCENRHLERLLVRHQEKSQPVRLLRRYELASRSAADHQTRGWELRKA
ncbi:MAG: IS3 family transposase [Geminicoccaceae bacterium]